MSVPVGERNESPIQFMYTAKELAEHTLRYTSKQFNKKDCDLVKRMRDAAIGAYELIIQGNSVYVKTKEDKILRRSLFTEAKAKIYGLSALITLAKNNLQNTITPYGWSHWGDLINTELPLLSGIIKKDEDTQIVE